MNVVALIVMWSVWYLNFSTRTILSPLLPIIEEELHLSHTLAGSIYSFQSAGYTVSLLMAGFLAPRIGYKRSITVGGVMLVVALCCLNYTSSYWTLVIAVLFIGLGSGIYLPCAIPMLTGLFEQRHWGKVLACHDSAASASVFSVPLLIALSLRFLPWKAGFVVLGVVFVAAIVLFRVLVPDSPLPSREQRIGAGQLVRRKEFWIIAALWVCAAGANLGLYNVIPLFLVTERGLSLDAANTVFGISRMGGFFMALLSGVLVDRFGVKRVLLLALLPTGFGTMGVAVTTTFPLLVAMLVVQATFCMAFFPVCMVAISKVTSPGERSAFTGTTIAVGVFAGLGLTPPAVGMVADLYSFEIGIFAFGLLVAASCLLLKKLPPM